MQQTPYWHASLRTCLQRAYDTYTSNDPITGSQHKSHVLQRDKIIHGICSSLHCTTVLRNFLVTCHEVIFVRSNNHPDMDDLWRPQIFHSLNTTIPKPSQEKETAKLRHSRDAHYQLTKPLLVRFHTGHVTRLCRTLERCWLYDTSFTISAEYTTRERLASVQCHVTQPSCSQIF